MISREELQARLREFGPPLDKCAVQPRSTIVFTPPHEANISFVADIYGKPEVVEVEMDLRSIQGPESIGGLAAKILKALQARAEAAK